MVPTRLRYCPRDALVVALRFKRLFRRSTLTDEGKSIYIGECLQMPDGQVIDTLTAVIRLDPKNDLDLSGHFEAAEGIWCPIDGGDKCLVFEFFTDEKDEHPDEHPLMQKIFAHIPRVIFDN